MYKSFTSLDRFIPRYFIYLFIYLFDVILKGCSFLFCFCFYFEIYMGPQKIQNCQSNPEEKEQSWRHNPPRLQTILQSYSNQNSVVLALKQTYGSVEQNREPRNKPTYLRLTSVQQRRQEYKMEKRQSLQQVVLGKLNSRM